jgi:hypothetical protein
MRFSALARRLALATVPGLLIASSGCSSPGDGQHVVFKQLTGFRVSGPIHRDEVISVGVPPLPLHNLTGSPVRIVSVKWVGQPAAAHVLNIYAYNYRQVGHGLNSLEGNLPVACPRQYRPHPISSFTTPPHSDAAWFMVIAFTINKLGHYAMNRVKITYTADGHQGWQYLNINQKFTVVNPPLPGPVPIPRSGICG